MPDLRAAIAAEASHALLVDVNAWGATAAAETSGLPWALFCPYCLPLPSRDVPPSGSASPPRARSGSSAMRSYAAWCIG